jgi:hypothetical protein
MTLSEDEIAQIKSILIALRAIKVRDIDKALVILSKAERLTLDRQQSGGMEC